MDKDIYLNWIDGSFAKIVFYAKDEAHFKEIIQKAKSLSLEENIHYFNIVDEGRTSFHGIPTWAVIGFIPMEDNVIDQITGDLQLAL